MYLIAVNHLNDEKRGTTCFKTLAVSNIILTFLINCCIYATIYQEGENNMKQLTS